MQRNTSFNRNHDDSGLFSKVNEAITSFYTNIIAESVKRIEVIKENTKAILLIINEMHSTSRKDYFSYSFTENTIVKMVKIMQKSEKYFKKQIENFCYDLDWQQVEITFCLNIAFVSLFINRFGLAMIQEMVNVLKYNFTMIKSPFNSSHFYARVKIERYWQSTSETTCKYKFWKYIIVIRWSPF